MKPWPLFSTGHFQNLITILGEVSDESCTSTTYMVLGVGKKEEMNACGS